MAKKKKPNTKPKPKPKAQAGVTFHTFPADGTEGGRLWAADPDGPILWAGDNRAASHFVYRPGAAGSITDGGMAVVLDGSFELNGVAYGPQDIAVAPEKLAPIFHAGPEGLTAVLLPACARPEIGSVFRAGLYVSGWDDDWSGLDEPVWQNSGARSLVISRHKGEPAAWLVGVLPIWRGNRTQTRTHDWGFVLIEGDLTCGDTVCAGPGYGHIPAGAAFGPLSTTDGATLLFVTWPAPKRPTGPKGRNDEG